MVSSRQTRSESTISAAPRPRPDAGRPGWCRGPRDGTRSSPAVDFEPDSAGLVAGEQPAPPLGDPSAQLDVGPIQIDNVDRGAQNGGESHDEDNNGGNGNTRGNDNTGDAGLLDDGPGPTWPHDGGLDDGEAGGDDVAAGDSSLSAPGDEATWSAPATVGAGAEVELWVRLSTLLGLDRYPAELAGWGYVHAELARELTTTLGGAQWRFALTDEHGPRTRPTARTRSLQ